jgi:hypothetical protein
MGAVEQIADLRAQLAEREAELATARAELTGAHLLIEQYKAQSAILAREGIEIERATLADWVGHAA